MPKTSKIEWTQFTWNPVTGCSRISEGCRHCYAERMAGRLYAMGSPRYRNGFEVTLHPDLIDLPRRMAKPRLIFVNSMSDLFHEKIPDSFIHKVFDTMAGCPQHTFQVLTKRSERLHRIASRLPWPSNVWMGVSVENQKVISRAMDLAQVPAHIRFLSLEPMPGQLEKLPLSAIAWVIVGGESGPGARPMKEEWVQSIRLQCQTAGVAFFFKQWGGVNKHATGRMLNGRSYDEMPRMTLVPKRTLAPTTGSRARRGCTSQWKAHGTKRTHVPLPVLVA